jgi:hypothetical protein
MACGTDPHEAMTTSLATHIRMVLQLDRMKRSGQSGKRLVFSLLVPVLNLFFCAYYERFMKGAGNRSGLDLFLTVECVVLALLATVHFVTSLKEIAKNIRLLPVHALPLVLAVHAALFRDQLSLGILATGAFGLAVILHPGIAALSLLVLIVFLLGAGVQAFVGCALLVAFARSDCAAGVTLLCLLSLLASVLWSMAFRAVALPLTLPPVLWASRGMESAIRGAGFDTAISVALLIALPLLILGGTVWWMERS